MRSERMPVQAMATDPANTPARAGRRAGSEGRSNLRTALVLLSIALVFFAGVIVNRWLFQ